MPKGRGIVRTPLVILSRCGVLCLLQCAEKSREKVERPLDAARLIAGRIKDTQTVDAIVDAQRRIPLHPHRGVRGCDSDRGCELTLQARIRLPVFLLTKSAST